MSKKDKNGIQLDAIHISYGKIVTYKKSKELIDYTSSDGTCYFQRCFKLNNMGVELLHSMCEEQCEEQNSSLAEHCFESDDYVFIVTRGYMPNSMCYTPNFDGYVAYAVCFYKDYDNGTDGSTYDCMKLTDSMKAALNIPDFSDVDLNEDLDLDIRSDITTLNYNNLPLFFKKVILKCFRQDLFHIAYPDTYLLMKNNIDKVWSLEYNKEKDVYHLIIEGHFIKEIVLKPESIDKVMETLLSRGPLNLNLEEGMFDNLFTKDKDININTLSLKRIGKTKFSLYKNNRLVAWVNVSDTGYIYYLETKHDYRGRGLGSFLIGKAINELGGYWLHIERPNIRVQKWYESIGFVLYEPKEEDKNKYVRLMVLRDRIKDFEDLQAKSNGNLKVMLGNLANKAYKEINNYENNPEVRTVYDDKGNILKEDNNTDLDIEPTDLYRDRLPINRSYRTINTDEEQIIYTIDAADRRAKELILDKLNTNNIDFSRIRSFTDLPEVNYYQNRALYYLFNNMNRAWILYRSPKEYRPHRRFNENDYNMCYLKVKGGLNDFDYGWFKWEKVEEIIAPLTESMKNESVEDLDLEVSDLDASRKYIMEHGVVIPQELKQKIVNEDEDAWGDLPIDIEWTLVKDNPILHANKEVRVEKTFDDSQHADSSKCDYILFYDDDYSTYDYLYNFYSNWFLKNLNLLKEDVETDKLKDGEYTPLDELLKYNYDELLAKNLINPIEYLYHCTLKSNLESIKKNGLVINSNKNWSMSKDNVIYLTVNEEDAVDYMYFAKEWGTASFNDEDLVTLKVKVDDLDTTKLFLDANEEENGYWVDDKLNVLSFEYRDNIPFSNLSKLDEEIELDTTEPFICKSLNKHSKHKDFLRKQFFDWYRTEWEVWDTDKIKTLCDFIVEHNDISGNRQIIDIKNFIHKLPFTIALDKTDYDGFGYYNGIWSSNRSDSPIFYFYIQLGPHSKNFTIQPIKDSKTLKLVTDLLKEIDAPRLNEVDFKLHNENGDFELQEKLDLETDIDYEKDNHTVTTIGSSVDHKGLMITNRKEKERILKEFPEYFFSNYDLDISQPFYIDIDKTPLGYGKGRVRVWVYCHYKSELDFEDFSYLFVIVADILIQEILEDDYKYIPDALDEELDLETADIKYDYDAISFDNFQFSPDISIQVREGWYDYALDHADEQIFSIYAMGNPDTVVGSYGEFPPDLYHYNGVFDFFTACKLFKEFPIDTKYESFGIFADNDDGLNIILSARKNTNINESKEDTEKFSKWANDEQLVKDFYDNKQRLEHKDIYYWMKKEPSELRQELDNLGKTNKEKRKKALEGAELIKETDYWKVYRIDTVEAAKLLGKGTEWCISGTDEDAFDIEVIADDEKEAKDMIMFYNPTEIISIKQEDDECDDIYTVTAEMPSGNYYFNHYKEDEEASYYFLISKPENTECYGDERFNKVAVKANAYGDIEVYDSQDEEISTTDIPHFDIEELYNIW